MIEDGLDLPRLDLAGGALAGGDARGDGPLGAGVEQAARSRARSAT